MHSPLLLVFSAFPCATFADSLAEAYQAYASKDYRSAYQLWLPHARSGNAEAQMNIAYLQEQGLGLARCLGPSLC